MSTGILDQNSQPDAAAAKILQVSGRMARLRAAPRKPRAAPVNLKTDYMDEDTWIDLAATRGWKLPNKHTPATRAALAPWLKRLDLDMPAFRAWCDYSFEDWQAHNPTWSLRALVGLLLEDFPPHPAVESPANAQDLEK